MRTIRSSVAALAALPLALAGCAGSQGVLRAGDAVSIEAGSPLGATYAYGKRGDAGSAILGSMLPLACGPLAVICGPAMLVALEAAITAPPKPGDEQRTRAANAWRAFRDAEGVLLEAIRAEASARWRVTPDAPAVLSTNVVHVAAREEAGGPGSIELVATATLRTGADRTGFTATVEHVHPFPSPEGKGDPAAFDAELRLACREVAREIVLKLSR